MKTLMLTVALLMLAVSANAASSTFAWDAFPADTDVDGVRVYAGRYFGAVDYATPVCTAPVGTTTCQAEFSPWRFYKAVARAYADIDGEVIESEDSNVAKWFIWGPFTLRVE